MSASNNMSNKDLPNLPMPRHESFR